MLTFISHLAALFWAIPTLLRYFNLMRPDFIPLNDNGTPWTGKPGDDAEATWTRHPPETGTAAVAGAVCLYTFSDLLK